MNLTLCFDMNGCPNRCKHCWIGHMKNKQMKDDDAEFVVDYFKPYFSNITFYSWLREPDFCQDYKARWLKDIALSPSKKPERFELASFYLLVRDPNYVHFLKDVGVKKVQLTLFGMEELTDKYVGRKGAFKEILSATEILISNGISPRWQAFINEENKYDLLNMLKLIDDLKIKERCPEFEFFIHEGSCEGENEKLYDLKIEKGHVPVLLLPYYNDYQNLKTEHELIDSFRLKTDEYFIPSNQNGEITLYISNTFDVYFNFTNMSEEWKIGNLKADNKDELIKRIKNEDINALNIARRTSLAKLSLKYGNPNSNKLFSEDDFKMYLLNKMLRDENKNA